METSRDFPNESDGAYEKGVILLGETNDVKEDGKEESDKEQEELEEEDEYLEMLIGELGQWK